jgi:hypothetical protein
MPDDIGDGVSYEIDRGNGIVDSSLLKPTPLNGLYELDYHHSLIDALRSIRGI